MKCLPVKKSQSEKGTTWFCARCGFSDTDRHGHFPNHIHRTCPVDSLGLGDFIAAAFSLVGITQQRYVTAVNAVRRLFRKEPKQSCGCGRRRDQANVAWFVMLRYLVPIKWL